MAEEFGDIKILGNLEVSGVTTLSTVHITTKAVIALLTTSSISITNPVTLPNNSVATTQAASDNSTKIATTAYADAAGASKAPINDPTFTTKITTPAVVVNASAITNFAIKQATTVSVVSSGTVSFPGYRMFAYIADTSVDGGACLIICDGSASIVTIAAQTGTLYTTTKDSANKINIYPEGGQIKIQNKTTTNPVNLQIISFGAF